jgi:hypothetical protein
VCVCVVGRCRGSVAGIVSGLQAGRSEVQIPARTKTFFFAQRQYWLGSNGPPIKWVPGALSLEINRPGRHDDHSPPPSAQVKNE